MAINYDEFEATAWVRFASCALAAYVGRTDAAAAAEGAAKYADEMVRAMQKRLKAQKRDLCPACFGKVG